ncbi:5df3b948-16dd-4717-8094-30676dc9c3d4 [Thermothielavioides terrestris]|uniref:5df3b948-16dd-4717-8094-30676dc9c3d4 n=1 Tax=Thermothielavioides terrestris TaxID=2587410 RepID=A0A3S4D4P0_9PEZI|nr:5df3b948-16dd-4717-8094-30676dc9c3d4 [Thermothielavioides terrestris]
MEASREIPSHIVASVAGADAGVYENANTITKWLVSQPLADQPLVAEAIFRKLLQEASRSRQYHGNGHACVKLCSFVEQCSKSSDEAVRLWASNESLSAELFHFYLEWYEHDPHRALRLVLDLLVASSTSNPVPETGESVKNHILETLVSIVARKSPRQLTKSGLQCLDHFLNKRAFDLTAIATKYKEVEPSVANLSSLPLWRSFAFQLFSWMDLPYVCPLAGKCLVHIFRGLMIAERGQAAPDSPGFSLEVWRQWLQDALSRNPEILEDIKNYVLAPVFKTDRETSLAILEMFNRGQPLTGTIEDPSNQGLLLQLTTLELGKKYGLVEEPDNFATEPASSLIELGEPTMATELRAHKAFCARVESKISKAEEDLGHAAIESPVHADFAAIGYVWRVLAKGVYSNDQLEVLTHLQRRVFFCARQIWLTVQHVLCDDSPEGHLPEELEDIEGLDTKDLLSYSFRAVRSVYTDMDESENLLREWYQVHALNSLREIFRSSLLSKRAEGYLARTLHLAATSLRSEV